MCGKSINEHTVECCLVHHHILCFVLELSGTPQHMEAFEDKRLISHKLDSHSAAQFLLCNAENMCLFCLFHMPSSNLLALFSLDSQDSKLVSPQMWFDVPDYTVTLIVSPLPFETF